MMRPNRLFGLAFAGLMAAGAGAQQNYARTTTNVRAGILVVESQRVNGEPANFTPHAWSNLDSLTAVKPAGWSFSNPRPNSFVSQAVFNRWSAMGGSPAAVGTSNLGKRSAAYWEVRLAQAGDDVLADYDILLLSAYGPASVNGQGGTGFLSLNPFERDRLRRYVDQGGILWVDFSSTTQLDMINGLPIPLGKNAAGVTNQFADQFHPLLSYPNPINVNQLPLGNGGVKRFTLADAGATGLSGLLGPMEFESLSLLPLVSGPGGAQVSLAKLGDGYMLVTSNAMAARLNRVLVNNTVNENTQFLGLNPVLDRTSETVGKLIFNAINLGSAYSQAGQGSRKSSASPVSIDAPLMKSFEAPVDLNPGPASFFPPVLYKGLLILADQDHIMVFDANPKADLDGDGDPDDGIRDYGTGSNMDLLWESASMPGPISAPVAFEISGAAPNIPLDQIAVTDSNGKLHVFDAFQLVAGKIDQTPGGKVEDYGVNAPSGAASPGSGLGAGPYAPTFHEGYLYIADAVDSAGGRSGRVWMADPRVGEAVQSSSNPFVVGGSAVQAFNEITATPTVGYIPISNGGGGLDKVIYMPTRRSEVGSGPNSYAGIVSVWAGARGETPLDWSSTAGSLTITTRAGVQGVNIYIPNAGEAEGLGVRLTVLNKATGNPMTTAQLNTYFTGAPPAESGGILTYTLRDNLELDPNIWDIRVDYTLNWGTGVPSIGQQIVRGNVVLADNTTRSRMVLGQVALSPRGTFYAVMSDPAPSGTPQAGGTFYAFREEGRGSFRCVTRYDLYGQHTISPSGGTSQQYAETLSDSDGIQNFALPFLGGAFRNLRFTGGPAVRKDTVYVTARGSKGAFGVPATIVMAFRAEPETPEIKVNDLGDGNFTIVQPDVTRSVNGATPELQSQLTPGQFKYEKQEGAQTAVIRIENLMTTNRGPITSAISLSQPVLIRKAGQPDQLIEPDRNGSRWSPLLWYSVFHGFASNAAPFVAGRNLYVAGQSGLPSILTGGSPLKTSGQVYAVNADISTTDALTVAQPGRPWLKQAIAIKFNSLTDLQPNPNYLWPQITGVTSFETYRTRLLQTVLGDSTVAYGVVGGDGNVVAWGDAGVFGFNRADFLVVDESRVARFDPSGNPIWSADATSEIGVNGVGTAANTKKLVRPTRAYRLGESDTLIVDSGANRLVRVDNAGRETRSIDGFRLDPQFVPEGFQANEPLTFNSPRDVQTFTGFVANPGGVVAPRALEYWRHYVVADSGNGRVVQFVDRYEVDPTTRRIGEVVTVNGIRQLGVLVWHSPAAYSGKGFAYNNVARVVDQVSGRYVYAAGIGNSSPTRADIGLDSPAGAERETATGNGGIVILDPFDSANNGVINSVLLPQIPANIYWDEATNAFNSSAQPSREKKIGSIASLTARYIDNDGVPQVALMFTDPTGAYEIVGAAGSSRWDIRWMLTKEAYTHMRGLTLPFGGSGQPIGPDTPNPSNPSGFLPTFARRLDSGEVLIVNGYQGTTRQSLDGTGRRVRNLFQGEVIQVDGSLDLTNNNSESGFGFGKVNLGFGIRSIKFELPPIQGTRTLLVPIFADRR
jgi:hypothetical protein